MSSSKTLQKLLSYSAMVGAVVVPNASNGQIVYTDINPDTIFTAGPYGGPSFFGLDFNHDGVDDTFLEMGIGMGTGSGVVWVAGVLPVSPFFNAASIIASQGASKIYPLPLAISSLINNTNSNWKYPNNECQLGRIYKSIWTFIYQQYTSTFYYGNFIGVPDAYIGIKLDFNNNKHFGWIRIGLDSIVTQLTIKSFAYETTPNKSIKAGGIGHAYPCTNIQVFDKTNYGDGRDMEVSFTKSSEESTVNSYRIIVVPLDSAQTFDTTKANSLSSNSYLMVPKTGSNIVQILNDTLLDSEGNQIILNKAYSIFVLNVANTNFNLNNSLSGPSSSIILLQQLLPVVGIGVNDVSDFGNASDINVVFPKLSSEDSLAEYRVIVVKDIVSGLFNLDSANALTSSCYEAIVPNGNFHILNLSSYLHDSDNDPIITDRDYSIFVMCVADTNSTIANSLSTPSQKFSLTGNALRTSNLLVEDSLDNGDSKDIFLQFNKAVSEQWVDHYRVIMVKDSSLVGFDLNSALGLTSNQYEILYPTGNDVSHLVSSSILDSDGDSIIEQRNYRAIILSVADSLFGGSSVLSSYSPIFSLSNDGVLASNVRAFDIGNNNDASDIEVRFDKAINETSIIEYRIIVVNKNSINTVDLQSAHNLTSDRYDFVVPNASNIIKALYPTLKDTDGNTISNGEYFIYILSITNNLNYRRNRLSQHSTLLKLEMTVPQTNDVKAFDIGNNSNSSDVEIQFNKAIDETLIEEYRIVIVQYGLGPYITPAMIANQPPDRIHSVLPNGSNVICQLKSNMNDISGIPITNNMQFEAYVLSFADSTTTLNHSLSTPSNSFILQLQVLATQNVKAFDIGDNNNSNDIEIQFDIAADETLIEEYRIVIVEDSLGSGLTPALVANLPQDRYHSVTPNGSNVVCQMNPNLKTYSGIPITNNNPYKAYVLSYADSSVTYNNLHALSAPSSVFTLLDNTMIEDGLGNNIISYVERGNLTIKSDHAIDGIIMIYTYSGQLIFCESVFGENHQIPIHQYSKGVYIIKISTDEGVLSRKLVF